MFVVEIVLLQEVVETVDGEIDDLLDRNGDVQLLGSSFVPGGPVETVLIKAAVLGPVVRPETFRAARL